MLTLSPNTGCVTSSRLRCVSAVSNVFPTDRIRSRVDALGTFAGRLGYAMDRSLLYVKGGGAWAHDKFSITDIPTGITYARFDQTRWGWMIGAGLEHGITVNWSAKIEYNFMDLGTERSTNVVCSPNFGCVGPGGSFAFALACKLEALRHAAVAAAKAARNLLRR